MIVGIQSEILKMQSLGLLERLLKDKTTKTNIIWATDAYADKGRSYERDQEIKTDLITGTNSGIIKNRARKALEHQSERTRTHAEVFTPVWICQMMNDYADKGWFYKKDKHPFQNKKPVQFLKTKKWQRYIDARRLEITCGEAPYLVSRYDVATGESIPIRARIGILDRKIRVVTENTDSEADWIKWVIRAFQATYGYEFQGDNLLIARINLMMTFEEYLEDRWKRKPTQKEYQTIANIVSWNIWQMDGLVGTIPYCKAEEHNHQYSIFDFMETEGETEEKNEQPVCKIYDWRRDNSREFIHVNEGVTRNMKFDFIIGNPPYQEEQDGDNKTFAPPIYHKFLDATYKLSDCVELIHPARFLYNAGSTPKEWNRKMLADPHLKVLHYEQDSSKIFSNTDIKGGVAVTLHDATKDFGAISVFTQYEELNLIKQKVNVTEEESLTAIIFTQNRYDLDEIAKEYRDYTEFISSGGKDKRFRNNAFARVPAFKEKRVKEDDYQVLGVLNNKRVYRYIERRFVESKHENLSFYKVLVPRANGSGVFGEILSTPVVIPPNCAYTQTFIGIGAFEAEIEAKACLKYLKSKFCRAMLGILKITQHNERDTWRLVPIQDYSDKSDIDWSKSIAEIDQQLYAKYGLSEEEISFIESHVKEME